MLLNETSAGLRTLMRVSNVRVERHKPFRPIVFVQFAFSDLESAKAPGDGSLMVRGKVLSR